MEGETTKTYVFGQDSNPVLSMVTSLLANRGVDATTIAALSGRNGFLGGDNLLALIILFAIFGGNFGNFGGRGGCGAGAVATDMIMQTLNRNGVDISSIANALNTTTASINSGICNLANQISTMSGNMGMSAQQIINSIQAGNTSIASQIAQCCCDSKLLATQQGYENRIANSEQTAILGSKIDQQTTLLNDKFCQAEMRDMQAKIDALRDERSALMAQLSNEHQTANIQAYVGQVVSPLASKVAEIERKLPNTVTLPYSCATAVPTAALYGAGYPFAVPTGGSIWN